MSKTKKIYKQILNREPVDILLSFVSHNSKKYAIAYEFWSKNHLSPRNVSRKIVEDVFTEFSNVGEPGWSDRLFLLSKKYPFIVDLKRGLAMRFLFFNPNRRQEVKALMSILVHYDDKKKRWTPMVEYRPNILEVEYF